VQKYTYFSYIKEYSLTFLKKGLHIFYTFIVLFVY
jgi:hypothetical protein